MKRTTAFLILIITFGLSLFAGQAGAAPLTGVTTIGARASNTCAVVAGGQVRCWGENFAGQLGDGSTTDRDLASTTVLNPAGNGPLTGATQVTVGLEFSCARLSSGQARCWGKNQNGQLGNGTNTDSTRSVVVRNSADTGPLTGVTQLSAGSSQVCARRTDGSVRCWGVNALGQLGNGATGNRNLPTSPLNVAGTGPLTDVVQLASGVQHTCARLANEQVRCWGADYQGQIGNGPATGNFLRPVAVRQTDGSGNLGDVTGISAGDHHSCVLLGNGQARCWGDGAFGQLADADDVDRTIPVVVIHPGASTDSTEDNTTLTGVAQVLAAGGHSCFRLTNGQVRCAGRNGHGQLGDPASGSNNFEPILVRNAGNTAPLGGVEQIVGGNGHTCARGGGVVQCWGDDSSGQLGNGGSNVDGLLPTVVQF